MFTALLASGPARCVPVPHGLVGVRGEPIPAPASATAAPTAPTAGSQQHLLPDLQPSRASGQGVASPLCLVTCKIRHRDTLIIFTSVLLSCGKVAYQLFISSQDFSARGCHKSRIMCCLQCLASAPVRYCARLFVVTE